MRRDFKDFGFEVLLVEDLLETALCDHIIQVAECCQFKPSSMMVNVLDTDVRGGGVLLLSDEEGTLQGSTNQLLLKKIQTIQEMLFRRYGTKFPNAEVCSILRYFPGQSYKRHVDNLLLESRFVEVANGIPTRDISIIGYLNDDFEGGEILFDRQNIKIKPQKGDVLVFPSYYTHPNQSLPVIRGKKYSFTSWLFH